MTGAGWKLCKNMHRIISATGIYGIIGMAHRVAFRMALGQYDALSTEGDVSRLREIVSSLTDISEFERWWNRDSHRQQNPDSYLKRCLREADALVRICRTAAVWEEEGDGYLARVRENLRSYSENGRTAVEFLRPRELLQLLDLRHEIKTRRVTRLNVAHYELVSRCIRYMISEVLPGPLP